MSKIKGSLKYHNAIQFVEENEAIKRAVRGYKTMLSATLYASLQVLGGVWDSKEGLWKFKGGKQPDQTAAKVAIKEKSSARRDRVLVRIITHAAIRDVVISEFTELVEALNYTVDSVSDPYENDGGTFVRTYINLRRMSNG